MINIGIILHVLHINKSCDKKQTHWLNRWNRCSIRMDWMSFTIWLIWGDDKLAEDTMECIPIRRRLFLLLKFPPLLHIKVQVSIVWTAPKIQNKGSNLGIWIKYLIFCNHLSHAFLLVFFLISFFFSNWFKYPFIVLYTWRI